MARVRRAWAGAVAACSFKQASWNARLCVSSCGIASTIKGAT